MSIAIRAILLTLSLSVIFQGVTEAQKAQDTADAKKPQVSEGVKRAQAAADAKRAKAADDAKKAQDAMDAKQAQDAADAKKAQATVDAKKSQAAADAKRTQAAEDAKKAQDAADAKRTQAAEDARKAQDVADAKKAQAAADARKAQDVADAQRFAEAQRFNEAQHAPESAMGEAFNFEFRADYWFPTLSSTLRADNGNFKGTNINVAHDLGFDDSKPLPTAEMTLKFAERHKLRFDYTDFAYKGEKNIGSTVVFNGTVYPLNSRLKTDLQLRSIKAGYEYDIVRGANGYLAFRLAADNVFIKASIETPGLSTSTSASITAPVVGLAGRVSPVSWISLTADVCGVGYDKSTVYDYAVYADINPIRNLGVTVGWRSMRININVESTVSDTQWSGAFAGLSFRL